MPSKRRIITLGLITVVLWTAAFWARHEMHVAEIRAIFAVGPLSPVWRDYASVVTSAQLVEAQQREQDLGKQLESQACRWQVAAVAMVAIGAWPVLLANPYWFRVRTKE
jgi:hypothetical protein